MTTLSMVSATLNAMETRKIWREGTGEVSKQGVEVGGSAEHSRVESVKIGIEKGNSGFAIWD